MDFWDGFAHDPRLPANAGLRASDIDREVVRAQLTEAYADGRLTREEHDDRVGTTLRAKTLGELPPIVADLVLPSSAPARIAPSASLRARAVRDYAWGTVEVAAGAATPFLICTAIWLFSDPGGYFWPMWVLIPVLLTVFSRVGGAGRRIEGRTAQLEARERDERKSE